MDHKKKLIKPSFPVYIVEEVKKIEDLKKKVKEENPDNLKDVDASDLDVWKSTDSTAIFDDEDPETFKRQIEDAFSKEKVEKLGAGRKFAGLNFSEDEILFVQMPGAFPAPSFHPVILK
jgi:hypothetical protein